MNKTEEIKNQYTKYPYPKYNSDFDKNAPKISRINKGLFLEQINYYIYKGTKNFNNYSILFAGVGLGNNLIFMGNLLRKYKNIRLVGIDISSSSLEICKKRIKKYNLDNINIELIEMSLLDLDISIGIFDLIVSCGVLHHLEDPVKGLNSLKAVLKDDGGMYIMVYGKIGRTGIYQMQDLLRLVNKDVDNYDKKINNFKKIYKYLPKHNWFKFSEDLTNDHIQYGDNGIVDLLLHNQDRAYTVKELYNWIDNCNMNIIEFTIDNRYKYKYDIPELNKKFNKIEKYSINELYCGDIIKHSFYISKSNNKNTICDIENLDNIMILLLISFKQLNKLLDYYDKTKIKLINIENLELCCKNNKIVCSKVSIKNINMNDKIYYILKSIDNKTSTREIFNNLRKHFMTNISNDELIKIFKPIYKKFELYDLLLLKNQSAF